MNSARTAVADSYLSDLHEVGAEGSGESILLARRAAVSATLRFDRQVRDVDAAENLENA